MGAYTFGDVPVNASERLWVGARLRGQQALALALSTIGAPSDAIVAYNCTGASFPALTSASELTAQGAR